MDFVEGILVLVPLCHERNKKINRRMTIDATRGVTIGITRDLCLLFSNCEEHGGKCRTGMPPQILEFPWIENAVAFAKTPTFGTSPTNLLNERFR